MLDRLDKLEERNKQLTAEIESLRAELRAARTNTPLEDRVAVVENRVEEQAQSKVEASQRFPVSVTGMLLFNAFTNGQSASDSSYYSSLLGTPERTGATIGQTLVGLNFDGPEIIGGGKISGSLNMDFLGGNGPYDYSLRIRRGVLNFDWKDRSLLVGQDKPLVSQREPESLAEVAYPALADAGNPWLWVPQVRYTEHIHFGENAGIDAAASELETQEASAFAPGTQPYSLELARPGFESRANFWIQSGSARYEIAPGFHLSDTHVDGFTVPARFATIDWLIRPARWIEFTGLVMGGHNMAVLGGFSDGFTLRNAAPPIAVRDIGGWAQASVHLTSRLTLNTFGGLQAPHIADLYPGALTHETQYAGNLIYRLGPNILLGAEALQERAGSLGQSHEIRNHYDLAIGYLF
jgi:hypothetical protein